MQELAGIKSWTMLLCRELMTTDSSITDLQDSDLLQYFPLPPDSLPEAFSEHNKSPAMGLLPKTGCKGLQVSSLHLRPFQTLRPI